MTSPFAVPNFIIHATGSLGNMPDLGKKPYRLKCRFEIGAGHSERQLEKAKYLAAEQFVADMAVKGFEYIGESSRLPPSERGFRMTFKGAHIKVTGARKPPRVPSAREMLPEIMQGNRFRAQEDPAVMMVPHWTESEYLDYELSAVFIHETILFEVPDAHEERRNR